MRLFFLFLFFTIILCKLSGQELESVENIAILDTVDDDTMSDNTISNDTITNDTTQGYHFFSAHFFDPTQILSGWPQPENPGQGDQVAVYFLNGLGYYVFKDDSWHLLNFIPDDTKLSSVLHYDSLRVHSGDIYNHIVRVLNFTDTVDNVIYTIVGGLFRKSSIGEDDGGTKIISKIDSTVWERMEIKEVLPDWWEKRNDSKKIQTAVNFAGNGGKVIFRSREYIIDSEIFLDSIQNLYLDGQQATLKAASGDVRNAVLSEPYSEGSYQITVSQVPKSWEPGSILVMVVDSTNEGTSGRSQIDSINGNTIYLKYYFTSQFGGLFPSSPAGTHIIKYLTIFRGRPSAEEGVFGPEGQNQGTIIENFIFDGNKSDNNEVSLSWSVNNLISLHGRGSEIRSCKFINAPSEVITGHGINVHNNVFENCNGSVYHLSANDITFDNSYPAYFINNTVINCNTTLYNVNGHNEGIISFSWNGGYIIVNGNYFIAGATSNGIIGSLSGFEQGPDDREIVILSNNYCKAFNCIVYGSHQTSTRSLLITGNIFEDCGCLMQTLVNDPSVKVCGNVQVGTTDFGIDFRNNCDYRDMIDQSLGYGKNSLLNTAAYNNTAFGHHTLEQNVNGNFNTAVGENAGRNQTSGDKNTLVGTWAGFNMIEGNENTVVGFWSRSTSASGNRNVHVGSESGRTNTGSGNVFIGTEAGRWVQGDNNLIIHNNDSSTPLIQGKFDEGITVNGNLKVNGLNFLRLPRLTDTERDNLTGLIGGEIIFNTSTSKLQAYDGLGWVDLY
ncbi:MAG: hypothetical protein IPM42_10350 [Saprospiraceae bacterium]|nr:hypothetical protein [Saprospiraceae bacterium]